MYFPAPPLPARPASTGGRRPRHGHKLAFGDPATWPEPAVTRARRRPATAPRGDGLGPDAPAAGAPRQRGRTTTANFPSSRAPSSGSGRSPARPADADPVWLWSSRAGTTEEEVNRAWQAFLRRFDIEHMFRFCKQQLGWTRPNSATRPPPTAGPGSSSPPTSSCTSPAISRATSGCPGSSPALPAASPRPGSAGVSAASARTCPFPPARRNPPGPAPAARRARRTKSPPPATTSAKPSSARNRRRRPAGRHLK